MQLIIYREVGVQRLFRGIDVFGRQIKRMNWGIGEYFYIALFFGFFAFGAFSMDGAFWFAGVVFAFISGLAGLGIAYKLMRFCSSRLSNSQPLIKGRVEDSTARIGEVMSAEEAEKWFRDKTMTDALGVGLADGIYKIVFYNSQYSHHAPNMQIDPFALFSHKPREQIQEWIQRSNKLLTSNYPVGDALVGKRELYGEIAARYIDENPGFSNDTYSHAIHLGASDACF